MSKMDCVHQLFVIDLCLVLCVLGGGYCTIMFDSNKHNPDNQNEYRAFEARRSILPNKNVIQPQTDSLRTTAVKSLSLLDYNKDLCRQDTVILRPHDVLSLTQLPNTDGKQKDSDWDVDNNFAIDNRQQPLNDQNLIGKGICIDALNLKKASRDNVVLLNDISLAIPGGAFVALVGSSGAVKSTLMNAIIFI